MVIFLSFNPNYFNSLVWILGEGRDAICHDMLCQAPNCDGFGGRDRGEEGVLESGPIGFQADRPQ